MRVMRGHQEQHYWNRKQILLRWRELVSIVDLLPHVKIVVGPRVKVKRDAADPVKHQVGSCDVGQVGEGPGGFLGDAGDDVVEDLEAEYEDRVDEPGAC